MSRTLSRLLLCVAAAVVLWSGIATVAMVSQLADAAERIARGAGQPVFWALLGCITAAVLVPTVWLLRLPPALRCPATDDAAAMAFYGQQLRRHLAHNPRLTGQPLDSEAEVAAALALLRSAAESHTRHTATAVMASTALLQNGRLDALVVMASQVRLVWQIARIYGLRPSLRQVTTLYGQVGACMLLASNLDDVDFTELTAPLVHSAAPATLGSLPGLGGLGSLLVNSLANGAANAFLTLRVGLVADAYCAPQHHPERQQVRSSATRRAAQLLGSIVKDTAGHVTGAVYGRIKDSVVHTAQAASEGVKNAGRQVGQATQQAWQATSDQWQHSASQVRDSAQQLGQHSQRSVQDAVSRLQAAVESLNPKGKP